MIYCDLGHKVQSRRTLRNLCFAKEIYRHESMTYILAECDHFTLSEYLPVIVRRVAIYPTNPIVRNYDIHKTIQIYIHVTIGEIHQSPNPIDSMYVIQTAQCNRGYVFSLSHVE